MNDTPILHVDADAFFASVEQRLEPKYRGKPVIVGGSHRGVVSSASYEARQFGIHSAMPIFRARKLCPHGIFVKGRHGTYGEFSHAMSQIFKKYTPTVEMSSIDEGYLDLTGTTRLHKASYHQIATRLLLEVEKSLGITISGAISSCKLVSKIASSRFKPRRLSWILNGQEKNFLAPLPLKAMPGIGPQSLPKFTRLGLSTIGDLAQLHFETMWQMFGGYGMILWERSNGIDHRSVSPHAPKRKSISQDKTFPIDLDSPSLILEEATRMLKKLCYQIRKERRFAATLTLKIRYSDFATYTHQRTLNQPSNIPCELLPTLKLLLKKRDPRRRVRLLGVGLSNLQSQVQLELFGSATKNQRLEESLDQLRKKYGLGVI
jgi:DNA polymerase IV